MPRAHWEDNMLSASEKGHNKCVEKLIAQTNMKEQLESLNKSLHRAARQGHSDTVRVLLQAGSEVNCAVRHGKSALMLAADQGHTQTVQVLLEAGSDIDKCDGILGLSALNRAVLCGHTDTVQSLLRARADVNSAHAATGKASLTLAAQKGYIQIVKLLLEWEANIHAKDVQGWNALFWATFSGQTKSMHILLEAGLDVNSFDSVQDTPLMVAIRNNQKEVAHNLLQYGAKVNCGNQLGITPLMESVTNNNIVLVELLLNKGAHVNQVNAQGMTALHCAAQSFHLNSQAILMALLLSGADVRIADINMKSALDKAIESLVQCDAYCQLGNPHPEYFEINEKGGTDRTLFLYAAGATVQQSFIDRIDKNRGIISQIILDDQQLLLALTGLCRRNIRDYLLRYSGANQNNLILSVPLLPLPRKLQDFLLFDVDIVTCQWIKDSASHPSTISGQLPLGPVN